MKKWIAFLLTAVLTASLPIPAFAEEAALAAPNPPAEVSMNTIQTIMEDYSLELQNLLNNLKIAKEKKEDPDYYNLSEDAAKYQYKLAQKEYDSKVQNTVLNAKLAYLAYCADSERLTEAQTAADNAQKAWGTALQAFSLGYTSQKEVDSLRQQADQAKSTLTQLGDQLTQKKAVLRMLLNLPRDIPMNVRPLSATDLDFKEIAAVDYGADVIEMWRNSEKIKAARLTYDYTEENYDTDYELDNAEIALQQVRASEQVTFQKLYDALKNSYTAYQQNLISVQQKGNELALEQQAFLLGYSSQKAVDGKTQELRALRSTLADSLSAMLSNYLSYTNMKNGYSAGS